MILNFNIRNDELFRPAVLATQCPSPLSNTPTVFVCVFLLFPGRLFRAASDQSFGLSPVSSAFPMVNHPAFGLHTNSGAVDPPIQSAPLLALAADWWRASEAHRRSAAAFFPPLLGLPPMFTPPVQNHESSTFQSRTPSKNGRDTPKGACLTNQRNSCGQNVLCLRSPGASSCLRLHSKYFYSFFKKFLLQKLHKKAAESSSNSDSESGTSSDTSSEGVSSSDSEDLDEDEDEDEDEEDQSNESEDSDSEREKRVKRKVGISEGKKDIPRPAEDREPQANKSSLPRGFPVEALVPSHFSPPPSIQSSALASSSPLVFQSPGSREEAVKPHMSVIQATGLAASIKPLALVTQPRQEPSPKTLDPSPKPLPLTSSPKPLPLTSSPKPLPLTEHFKTTFPVHLKKQQESYKTQKKAASVPLSSLSSLHSNLFLSSTLLGHHHPNGVIQSAIQEAPLALITKPRSQVKTPDKPPLAAAGVPPFSTPVNLSMVPTRPSTSPGLAHAQGKNRAPKSISAGRGANQSHLVQSLVDLFRGTESDIPSSKDSDDSVEDEDDEEEEEEEDDEEDSDDSPSGSAKRRRVDEQELQIPLELGWRRETRIRNLNGRVQGDVAYYAPCGKKLRQYPDVVKGLQWTLLTEEEILPHVMAMEGRRSRPLNLDGQQQSVDGSRARRRKGRPPNVGEGEVPSSTDAKLLRKLEAQEIARQAAQIKLMRKLEKQALARAAKEARKQQAIVAAEEKRKQKEQIKILKQQEKIKRIQQIRMEKELRAQQILEAKRKKKEEAANAKILEAEKRTKVAPNACPPAPHQERERRRQHMMLMKAVEARKKAEERERLKQEKRDEKRINKERKLELRRLELEMAKELKKPNEDLCLADHKPLPELSRIPGLVLPGSSFSDCLMVMQFLRSFGKVLGFDVAMDVPSLGVLQEGLLNVGDSMGAVQDLLVRMVSAVVCDPGLPPGHRTKTALGDHLTNVGINRDNVSEILQIYMEAHCGQTELADLSESLKTKAFQAHTPTQKACILAFLVNELACSKSVVSEIDKNIDHMTNLRRDKWVVEGKLRKLRSIHAKKTGKRESGVGGEEAQTPGTPTVGRKRKRKTGDSDDDEDDDEDSDDQGDEDDEEEEECKKGKKVEACEDEDESYQVASVEELEKQIDKLTKQQNQIRRKLFEASHSLRSMMFGQDRYKRRYWVLPQCGGVFVEGMESGEGLTERERERYREQESAVAVEIKKEPPDVLDEKPSDISQDVNFQGNRATPESGVEKDSPNLFLQKPGSFSKLSKLLEVAKMSPELESQHQKQNGSPVTVPMLAPSPPHAGSQSAVVGGSPGALCVEAKPEPTAPRLSLHFGFPGSMCSSQQLLPGDQLFRALTERNGHWFSLLPRSPCDDSSLTTAPTPPAASSQSSSTQPKSPASSLPIPLGVSAGTSPHTPVGMGGMALSVLQVKPGISGMGLQYCAWSAGIMSPSMAFPGSSTPGASYPGADGNGNPFLAPSVATSKSESPVPPSEKPSSAPSPAMEVAKPQDYPTPQPIPEEMLTGWWKVSDMEELRALAKALHSRGVREKALQKQIQKHMEYIAQACAKNRDAAVIDVTDLEENQVTEETLESWCIEEQAMEMDIAVLQQVEELERKVTSASLQIKGWIYPEPQSEREDLVYHEHKPFTKRSLAEDKETGPEQEENGGGGGIVRRVNNPLDIAVTRLAELEKNIERRYLKSPLSTTIQIKLDNVGTVTVPAPAPSGSGDGEGSEEDIAPGMKVWRKALSEVRSAAQLALCIQQLQKSIAWERSIMKVYCQICRKGDNEELLLLCDGCDKGCHTYCHRPKITTIPEGDWFCPACISKASGQSPKSKKLQCRPLVGKKNCEAKRNRKLSVAGEISEDDAASASGTPKKGTKDPKKRKVEESPSGNQKPESPSSVKKMKPGRDNCKDLVLCSILLSELESHQDAWPFLTPVNPKSVPGYKKVIKKPMDFSTIREKLSNNQYQNLETFIIDVNLVFDNCEKFNEDNSDIGRAGHNMRKFFERRWTELLKTT
uniref:Bromodomain adjacent to zinc finger domain 2B n=1 Tax=Paramormyrops kingsleyae TaxID=1676925 RepID=A0A3B3RFA1_9TELE